MVTCFEFSPQETSVTVWIGTSLISKEMAESNLKSEVLRRFSLAFPCFNAPADSAACYSPISYSRRLASTL
jgi:hypothetical protein